MAIQAPAKDYFCPNFIKAIDEVRINQATRDIFSSFASPWFFRNSAKEYSELFDGDDFKVESSAIEATTSNYTVDEAFGIFESGAAAGYLNQDYYTSGLSQEYIEAFKNILRKSLIEQSDEQGNVPLIFYRIYLLAIKSG